jgi:hypothetical protein
MNDIHHESWWPSRYGTDDQIGSLNEITPQTLNAKHGLFIMENLDTSI